MGRPKKVAKLPELTNVDQKYIDLCLRTYNNVNYDDLFKRLSLELNKPEELIRDYANKQIPPIKDEQLPPEPKPKHLRPEQEMARNLLTPNRLTEPNKARHVTVMSEAASEALEKTPASPIKGSSRMRDVIFRQ